tara:strand:+ start:673 stop:1044 length:372 start_codon:yes stop_codon:yes gene_type:complete
MTQHIRTNKEQLQALGIDNVSGIVYNADELSNPHQGRQRYYGKSAKPSECPTVTNVVQNWLLGSLLPITYLTQRVAKGTQTRLRKDNITRGFHTRLRKGILNSLQMRKCKSLKEKQYGKKLNG